MPSPRIGLSNVTVSYVIADFRRVVKCVFALLGYCAALIGS